MANFPELDDYNVTQHCTRLGLSKLSASLTLWKTNVAHGYVSLPEGILKLTQNLQLSDLVDPTTGPCLTFCGIFCQRMSLRIHHVL